MPVNHIVYIPLVLGLGMYLGFHLGVRSVLSAQRAEERRRAREEAELDLGQGPLP